MHFSPGVILKPVRAVGNFVYQYLVYRVRFNSLPVNPYIFQNPVSREYFASVQVEIENHNDNPLLVSSIELIYGTTVLHPTSTIYAEGTTIMSMSSTQFPHRVEAHAHSKCLVMFPVDVTDIPKSTLIIRVGRYERRYDLSFKFKTL